MIRAHLATYPPRQALMLDVVARMAPQVDELFVVLNEYHAVPETLRGFANVEPILPSLNLKDAGKFLPVPNPDDLVFLIDDDIAYPPDYVAKTLERVAGCDMLRNVFAYQGNAWVAEGGATVVKSYMFRRDHDAITGAGLVGTGTVLTLGRNLPGLDVMESAAGFVDVRFCNWLSQRGICPWVLPRAFKWMRPTLPKEMKADSLFQTVHKAQPDLYVDELRGFLPRWRHMGRTYPGPGPRAVRRVPPASGAQDGA